MKENKTIIIIIINDRSDDNISVFSLFQREEPNSERDNK